MVKSAIEAWIVWRKFPNPTAYHPFLSVWEKIDLQSISFCAVTFKETKLLTPTSGVGMDVTTAVPGNPAVAKTGCTGIAATYCCCGSRNEGVICWDGATVSKGLFIIWTAPALECGR